MEQVRPAAAADREAAQDEAAADREVAQVKAVAAAADREAVQDEAVAAAAGWEETVRVPDPLEIASVRTAGRRHPIRPVSPAITRTALNAGPG